MARKPKHRKAKRVKIPTPKPVEEEITRRTFLKRYGKKIAVGSAVAGLGTAAVAIARKLRRRRKPFTARAKVFEKRLGDINLFVVNFWKKPDMKKMKVIVASRELDNKIKRIEEELKEFEKKKLAVKEKKVLQDLKESIATVRKNLKIFRNGYSLNKFVQVKIKEFESLLEKNWRSLYNDFKGGLTEEGGVIYYFPQKNEFQLQRVVDSQERLIRGYIGGVEKGKANVLPKLLKEIKKKPWIKKFNLIFIPPLQGIF